MNVNVYDLCDAGYEWSMGSSYLEAVNSYCKDMGIDDATRECYFEDLDNGEADADQVKPLTESELEKSTFINDDESRINFKEKLEQYKKEGKTTGFFAKAE